MIGRTHKHTDRDYNFIYIDSDKDRLYLVVFSFTWSSRLYLFFLMGLLASFQVTLHLKTAMPDSQRYGTHKRFV